MLIPLGYLKLVNFFLCDHFWVNRSISMMCVVRLHDLSKYRLQQDILTSNVGHNGL
jgi:hypothetical protein